MQEEFLRKFFERQRELGKQAEETTKLLARTNIEGILWAGLNSPKTQEKLEEVIQKLQEEREKQSIADLEAKIAALTKRKEEITNGDQV